MKYIIFTLLFGCATLYAQSYKIEQKIKIPKQVNETSGIVYVENRIITFNDSGGKPELYVLSTKSGKLKNTIKMTNAKNDDWESITQDENFIYIGDTGNNHGDRKNLVIYKIPKKDILDEDKVKAEKIYFSYKDQYNFKKREHDNNFDCEAIVAYKNNLLIFTKNWVDLKTKIYSIPKTEGVYVADKKQTIDINCLITSTAFNSNNKELIATAYNKEFESFLIWIKDFDVNKNNKLIKLPLTPKLKYANQTEAIAWKNNHQVYMTRESSEKIIKGKKYKHKQKMFLITLED